MAVTGHKTPAIFKRYQITDTLDMARAQAGMDVFAAPPRAGITRRVRTIWDRATANRVETGEFIWIYQTSGS
jgi:hypothetical protein